MNEVSIQEYFFRRIKEKLPPAVSLVDRIAELLYVSTDSAYRRIRGETPLVLEEVKILCEAYHISLDQLLQTKKDTILFSSVPIDNGAYSFKNYLQDVLHKLEYVNSFDQKEIIYLSKDFVLFHNFLFRPLFAFRYFFWMKSILQHPDFTHVKYSEDLLPGDIEQIGKEIIRLYSLVPSTEIWSAASINGHIEQIEYCREAGYFKSEEDVAVIYDALRRVIEHLRIEAELGAKFLPEENGSVKKPNFHFFHNRLVLGDNAIMVLLNGRKTLYFNYDVLNYMSTQDEVFCNSVHQKIQTFMRRATLISNVSEKQRNVFFNSLLKRIPDRIKTAL
ncbi:MAG TPA: helix-turn-helix domain-containing protein [Flavisolibacter sp.]|nr:helix-turn-helix domain-containing protein [Flavisolibacter sp.]